MHPGAAEQEGMEEEKLARATSVDEEAKQPGLLSRAFAPGSGFARALSLHNLLDAQHLDALPELVCACPLPEACGNASRIRAGFLGSIALILCGSGAHALCERRVGTLAGGRAGLLGSTLIPRCYSPVAASVPHASEFRLSAAIVRAPGLTWNGLGC